LEKKFIRPTFFRFQGLASAIGLGFLSVHGRKLRRGRRRASLDAMKLSPRSSAAIV
jgi:hypothetical protein